MCRTVVSSADIRQIRADRRTVPTGKRSSVLVGRFGPFLFSINDIHCSCHSIALLGRPVDLRRTRTRANIPAQQIQLAQEVIEATKGRANGGVDIPLDDNNDPKPPPRRRGQKDSAEDNKELESEAQDILEKLKAL